MDETMLKESILIVDDDPVYRKLSRSILSEKYNVFTVEIPSLGFKILKSEPIKYIITDYMLPEMNGLQFLEKVKEEYPDIEVIVISNAGDMDTVIEALRKGATDYFRKPFSPADLWMSIERTRKYARLNQNYKIEKRKNVRLKAQVEKEIGNDIIGKSKLIAEIKQQMKMVAKTPDTSVLIIGESGTGKELVARGIHNFSSRADEIFGAVNMSAIPQNLFESEFFGHKKGSFTGAITDKAGWFETTDNGTLFLDEIGEMTMGLQVKLLRVLEDRSFSKVGAQKNQTFDIRILAATNKNIENLTDNKSFRLDLFHRLGTFIIHLPPLRERKEDIEVIAYHFLHQLSKKMGKNIDSIDANAVDVLSNYHFPGNIRELKNIIERAVILCPGNQLLPKHLLMLDNSQISQKELITNTFDLKEIEKQTIIQALKKANFNKSEASKLLNLEWNALYRRIQKYDIELF